MLDGKLYAAGGEREADEAPDNSVERYDLETKAWEAVAPMATARISHAMTVLDSRMYTVGGHTNDYEGLLSYLTSVERYDPATNAWEAVAQMATARCNFAVAVLDDKLYAEGGYNLDDGNLSSVERYDPALDVWEAVAPMAVRRIAFGVAVLGGKLYAVGGQFVASVERYDPATNAWETMAPMPTARRSFGVAVLDGKLYVVGGEMPWDARLLKVVERFDPATNTWEELAPMATLRTNPGVAVL